jgi:small subunit ribosomal protein S8
MAISDGLGDSLTKLRNASRARHPSVEVRHARLVAQILDILQRCGFIRAYKVVGDQPATRRLRVYLKYTDKTPAISQIVRVSTPGARAYCKAGELPRVRGGLGMAILSTSSGVFTDREAFRRRIGGEVLCHVW